jgi:hypothetical protein
MLVIDSGLDNPIVQEIVRITNEGRIDNMDTTMNALAHKFRFETLAETARHRGINSEQDNTLRHRLGSLLVSAGQKLQAQAISEEGGHLSLDTDMCIEAAG